MAGTAVDGSSTGRLGGTMVAALLPNPAAPLDGMAAPLATMAAYDRLGAARGATGSASVGAIGGPNATSDRLFNFGERFYPEFFAGHPVSATGFGYYYRYYPATQTYLGSRDGQRHQPLIKCRPKLCDHRRERIGKIAIFALPKAVSSHDDAASIQAFLVIIIGQIAAFTGS